MVEKQVNSAGRLGEDKNIFNMDLGLNFSTLMIRMLLLFWYRKHIFTWKFQLLPLRERKMIRVFLVCTFVNIH